jgi:4-aminobutyrate aminotransferase / (S)-3-amino-2-methylpropionate transaminase / 5-aminovalerate transaminase
LDLAQSVSDELELLRGPIPGPRTAALRAILAAHESRNVTYLDADFPVFWESAQGALVTDADANRYIDLTAAFGVANAGHANPRVAKAIADQALRLMHAMGDVHPTEIKTALLARLPQILPTGLDVTILTSTGSEAVEAALKTAMLATGKPAFAAFHGAYHGLSVGALSVTGIPKFRQPFAAAVAAQTLWLDYPCAGDALAAALSEARTKLRSRNDLAALIVEPIQGRGGCVLPPDGYLRGLRALCEGLNILLIFDEIATGFGRTGAWFAATHEGVLPDIICIGKAMGNGFPISAAVGTRAVMDAWPLSRGEALHTSTFLGNPMGCAAALATIGELDRLNLPERAKHLGGQIESRLAPLRQRASVRDARGRGLMWGIELRDGGHSERVVKGALKRGVIALQAGPKGEVISITPPLVISERQLDHALDLLEACIIETEEP